MIATLEEYSFRSGDPVHGGRALVGQLVDKHTFLGLIRIDYKPIQTGDQGYYEQIPEDMTLQLEIPYFSYIRRGLPRRQYAEAGNSRSFQSPRAIRKCRS